MQIELFTSPATHLPARSGGPGPLSSLPVYRVQLVREAGVAMERPRLSCSASVNRLLAAYLDGADREHFIVLLVDKKNRLIGLNTVAVGSLDAAVVHPREVFKPAILSNAAAVVLGHNHPSGDPTPSDPDNRLTKRLVEGGKLLGVQVLDHIVVGDGRYYSYADQGTLDR